MARSLFKRRKSAPTFQDLIWSSASASSSPGEYKPRNDEENALKEVQRTQRKGSLQIPNFTSPTLTDNRQCFIIQKKSEILGSCTYTKCLLFFNFYFSYWSSLKGLWDKENILKNIDFVKEIIILILGSELRENSFLRGVVYVI